MARSACADTPRAGAAEGFAEPPSGDEMASPSLVAIFDELGGDEGAQLAAQWRLAALGGDVPHALRLRMREPGAQRAAFGPLDGTQVLAVLEARVGMGEPLARWCAGGGDCSKGEVRA